MDFGAQPLLLPATAVSLPLFVVVIGLV